jgi:hypothetical protein
MVYVEKFVGFWLAGKTVSFVNRVRPQANISQFVLSVPHQVRSRANLL